MGRSKPGLDTRWLPAEADTNKKGKGHQSVLVSTSRAGLGQGSDKPQVQPVPGVEKLSAVL